MRTEQDKTLASFRAFRRGGVSASDAPTLTRTLSPATYRVQPKLASADLEASAARVGSLLIIPASSSMIQGIYEYSPDSVTFSTRVIIRPYSL